MSATVSTPAAGPAIGPATGRLTSLVAGQVIPFGGDRVATVGPDLAASFRDGDRLVVVHDTGDLLHLPAADVAVADAAVDAAVSAFAALSLCTDEAITAFFDTCARLLADDAACAPIIEANRADVADAHIRGRPTGRLELTEQMRADMVAGLRMWRDNDVRRDAALSTVDHGQWSVEARRAPLGVVGFVFEGRPNVFADACGVVRSGNTAVLRIGRDALGTARAVMHHAIGPALRAVGLPEGTVQLVDATAHAAGWALFSDRRLGLAIARGSGPAVAQLGAVARQHGVPVSLHGTGGAWLVAALDADAQRFAAVVRHSLDRKVCNTLNVCCVVRDRAADLVPAFRDAAAQAAASRGVQPVIHELEPDDPRLATEWEWDTIPEVALMVVDDVAHAVRQINRFSPRFVASLISDDPAVHDQFYRSVDAPFVGDGFTRWVDGQFALGQPELGLSNWQGGRLFGRGGVLSGDGVYTVRLRATVADAELHR